MNGINGKFIDCKKAIGIGFKESENIFIFKPDSDSEYNDKTISVMDKLMLANGLRNNDI